MFEKYRTIIYVVTRGSAWIYCVGADGTGLLRFLTSDNEQYQYYEKPDSKANEVNVA
jgi:hypothetical protein